MKINDVRLSLKRHLTKTFPQRLISSVTDIAIHHSLTKHESKGSNAEGYAKYHVLFHGWPGIGYHFVIEKDGTIKWCNDLENMSYHIGNSNRIAVGICLTGDFRNENPTAEQEESLRYLCNVYLPTKLPNLKNIKGHNEYPGYKLKQCPVFDFRKVLGGKFKKESVSVLKIGDRSPDVKTLQVNLNELGHNAGVVDGIFGPGTEKAVKSFQRTANLTVDGIVGPQTLAKIQTVLNANKPAAPKKESVIVTLGGKKYKIEEL